MKYKQLNTGELAALEKEFIHFLSSAQITGQDWIKMKKEESDKAEELIAVFSDMVYEKVMSKINYLEYRDAKSLTVFKCGEEEIEMVGLRVKADNPLDLTAANVFEQWNESESNAVEVIKSEKKYKEDRGLEVFGLLESGCLITDNRLFELISSMV
ncbi:MAG TPA: DUF6495 family protein [Bacteroidia bacterium]|jgi:hypothetical protein